MQATVKNKVLETVAAIVAATLFFLWGSITVANELFPYPWLKNLLPANSLTSNALTDSTNKKNQTSEVENRAKDLEWAKKIITGGYILYFRHAHREKWEDVQAFDAIELLNKIQAENASFAKAVCLSSQGVEEAKIIGEAFKAAKVQVSWVVSSPSCRSRQTAEHAFGRIDLISNSLLHRTAIMESQHEAFAKALRGQLEAVSIAPGKNVVFSGHAGTFRYDGSIVIDTDQVGNLDSRKETGFVVLERKDGKIIARHKFDSIKAFTLASLELPVN